jgi:hypothetical protein
MKIEHLDQCHIEGWYEKFKNVTFKSEFISIEQYDEFIQWLINGEFNMAYQSFPIKHSTKWEDELDPDNDFEVSEYEDDNSVFNINQLDCVITIS